MWPRANRGPQCSCNARLVWWPIVAGSCVSFFFSVVDSRFEQFSMLDLRRFGCDFFPLFLVLFSSFSSPKEGSSISLSFANWHYYHDRPPGTMYWANQQRFLSAEEVLALQGIFTKDFKAARGKFLTKHRRLCHDLTGNAFSMSRLQCRAQCRHAEDR